MVLYLLLGFGLLLALYAAAYGFATSDPKRLARTVKIAAVILLVAAAVLIAVTGRLGTAMWLAALGFPLIMRWRALWARIKSMRGPSPGQSSAIDTAFLSMRLDHDTGAMTGTVRQGEFAGWDLAGLSLSELLRLLAECQQQDPDGAAVLATYLDRTRPEWRDQHTDQAESESPRRSDGKMTRAQALRILGLEEPVTPEQIKEAHRRLMLKVHPDQGGSSFLAAEVNQAKDVLLGD